MAKEGRTVDRETGEVSEGTVRPFADVLRDLGKGQVADEAAVLLNEPEKAGRCGAKARDFRLTCNRPDGHVHSDNPADWHEADSTQHASHRSQDWSVTVTNTETVRWAPDPWDIQGGGR